MKVNIIVFDEGWILSKFAYEMKSRLEAMGIIVSISEDYDGSADINHYIMPNDEKKVDRHTTFMVTHIMQADYLEWIKALADKGAIGICMSRETMNNLIAAGVSRNRICYINPAQDGVIKTKKVVMGITHRVYSDNRKRESIIVDICKEVSPQVFKFVIMGSGWDGMVMEIREMGFEVDYYPEFDKEKYNRIIPELDYYCFFGMDEGSMGYLDAVAAGVKTIVTPQGFHLDSGCKITYPVETVDEIVDAFKDIERERLQYIRFSERWTWDSYTNKHLEIWNYQMKTKTMEELLANRGRYKDGIFSLLLDELDNYIPITERLKKHQDNKNE